MATDYKIMVQNVTKEYDLFKTQSEKLRAFFALNRKPVPHFWSLMGISLKIMPGETLGLIGVNGSGKSTLSNIISGIIPQLPVMWMFVGIRQLLRLVRAYGVI